MKKMRLLILIIALFAAAAAAFIATSQSGSPPVIVAERQIERIPMVKILVARDNIPVGARLNSEIIEWREWPEDAIVDSYFNEDAQPDAIEEITGAVVRLPIFQTEPIRSEKIVASSSRIMSSLLPAGKRAVATEISTATGAGGFILPNDRVDVIMVRRSEQSDKFITEIILQNIRVLAIDQRIEEDEEGNRTAVGTTATLELTPEQSEVMAAAQQMANQISLALRSIADVNVQDTEGATYLLSSDNGSNVKVIRSGKIGQTAQISE